MPWSPASIKECQSVSTYPVGPARKCLCAWERAVGLGTADNPACFLWKQKGQSPRLLAYWGLGRVEPKVPKCLPEGRESSGCVDDGGAEGGGWSCRGLREAVSVTCVWNRCRRGLRVDAGARRTQKAREGGLQLCPRPGGGRRLDKMTC